MTAKKKKFIFLAVAAAVLVALVIWIAWGNTALELNTYTISSSKLPQSFDGYRIAHVSDLHIMIQEVFLCQANYPKAVADCIPRMI